MPSVGCNCLVPTFRQSFKVLEMSASNAPTRLPVKVVFRITPAPKTGKSIGGKLADRIFTEIDRFNSRQVMAILPYTPLMAGMKHKNMVAMLSSGGEGLIVDYTTIIKNTEPAKPEEYELLLNEMETHGHYDVEVITATQIDHALRRAERVKGDIPPEQVADVEMVLEAINIDVDIVNDDMGAGTGIDSDSFKEEWG